ncbi:conserved exported hypothetical protein [Flavobacterium sp. 9R]|jgi:Domain of unknown function (DUF4252)|nr:conserved exported hypothetical protein [Flavobacterium sp. 9R]
MKTTVLIRNNKQSVSIMRTIFLSVLFVLMASPLFAQGAFDKFDGQDDVTSVIVNKKMFEMMSKVKVDASDKEMQQYHRLIKKLDNLKVFTTKSSRVEAEMKATAERYMKTANLEELMRVNDNGRSIKILVKSGAKDTQIRELLMFIDGGKGEDSVLMSLTGDFDLNEISVLTDKMRFPGGDDLKKATKGKK